MKLKKGSISLAMMVFLSGCAMNTAETNDWCVRDSIIMVSRHDVLTPGTARQILKHNDVGKAECSW